MSYFTIFSSESKDLRQEGSQHSRHLLGSQPGALWAGPMDSRRNQWNPMDPKISWCKKWCSGGISGGFYYFYSGGI